jgi:hypothetical protein
LRLVFISGTPVQDRDRIRPGRTAIGDNLMPNKELPNSNPVASFPLFAALLTKATVVDQR